MKKTILNLAILGALVVASNNVMADSKKSDSDGNFCAGLPTQSALKAALKLARLTDNGGFYLDMWGTIVDRDGIVCAVAYTGANRGSQWPGSRVISAQKANTANAFSLPDLAVSTANLYTAVQPGGSLFGLQESNPVDTAAAYKGPSNKYGSNKDPLVGNKIGGVNVFGGGLALYDAKGKLVGAIGVSGDSACADHNIAWKTRNGLKLDYVPKGVNALFATPKDVTRPDNIINDITEQPGQLSGISFSGWGHPECSDAATAVALLLPVVRK
jgi:uncharacterized protein GlcG (DUF336 family)